MDKLNTYTIEIVETLQKSIEIKAETKDAALQRVHEMYNDCEVVLDSSDLIDIVIK